MPEFEQTWRRWMYKFLMLPCWQQLWPEALYFRLCVCPSICPVLSNGAQKNPWKNSLGFWLKREATSWDQHIWILWKSQRVKISVPLHSYITFIIFLWKNLMDFYVFVSQINTNRPLGLNTFCIHGSNLKITMSLKPSKKDKVQHNIENEFTTFYSLKWLWSRICLQKKIQASVQ